MDRCAQREDHVETRGQGDQAAYCHKPNEATDAQQH